MSATVYQSYYTKSEPILNYMIGMIDLHPTDSILEPCGGDGVFVDKILEKLPDSNINVFELNPDAVHNLKEKYFDKRNIHIRLTDTLLDDDIVYRRYKYDKIIGNPPYGALNSDTKKSKLNRLYSGLYIKESYTLFLYASVECLREGGELSFIIPDTFLFLHRHESIRKYILTNTSVKEIALFPSSYFPGVNFGYSNLCIITLKKCSDTSLNLKNHILLREGFRCVEELTDPNAGVTKNVAQKEIYENIGSSLMFNSDNWITRLINDNSILKIGDIAACVTGFYSGDDKKYLHPINKNCKNAKRYECVNQDNISLSLTDKEKKNGIDSCRCYVPIVKGGNTKYIKPNEWFIDWSKQAVQEYNISKKCRFQNSSYYFRNGVAIPMISSSWMTASLIESRLFDQSIVGVFPKDEELVLYLLAFFNSKISTQLIKAINPSANNSANYIKKIPFIEPTESIKNEVDNIVIEIINILRQKSGDISKYEQRLDDIFSSMYNENIQASGCSQKPINKQLKLELT